MSARPLHLTALWALSVAGAAALGSALRSEPEPAATLPAPVPAPTASAAPLPPEPLVALAADGRITLRVEQQPLDWVLEQIALQGGPAAAAPAAVPATFHSVAPAAPCSVQRGPAPGSDAERTDALLQAHAAGTLLPEAQARALLDGAADERLRLAALEHWVAAHAGDLQAERAALEHALALPGQALQQEARQRLEDLAQRQRLDAEGQRPDPR